MTGICFLAQNFYWKQFLIKWRKTIRKYQRSTRHPLHIGKWRRKVKVHSSMIDNCMWRKVAIVKVKSENVLYGTLAQKQKCTGHDVHKNVDKYFSLHRRSNPLYFWAHKLLCLMPRGATVVLKLGHFLRSWYMESYI